jgi:aprataxin
MHVDDQCVLMLDGYPKARHHALVVAREPALDSMDELASQHLPLLAHMRSIALAWVAGVQAGAAGGEALAAPAGAGAPGGQAGGGGVPPGWRLGFHAVPSMQQLHLHVISQDFDSPALKNKKHWNSFTTAFFRDLDAVEAEVRASGRVRVDRAAAEQLLKQALRCHRCGCSLANIPQLKQHILACGAGAGLGHGP